MHPQTLECLWNSYVLYFFQCLSVAFEITIVLAILDHAMRFKPIRCFQQGLAERVNPALSLHLFCVMAFQSHMVVVADSVAARVARVWSSDRLHLPMFSVSWAERVQ